MNYIFYTLNILHWTHLCHSCQLLLASNVYNPDVDCTCAVLLTAKTQDLLGAPDPPDILLLSLYVQ